MGELVLIDDDENDFGGDGTTDQRMEKIGDGAKGLDLEREKTPPQRQRRRKAAGSISSSRKRDREGRTIKATLRLQPRDRFAVFRNVGRGQQQGLANAEEIQRSADE